ncbi:MAG: CBS domain-containing protein [Methanobrevibacter arboriphilus]|jgi:CBS domain-containing protein|uniref:CBS domain-containing protein n=2 Tax=Methanobrevibacter arboriphilus TaxID=39441 RepID=A0ACA8R557_METAZ|nr:CBS domain-containing protein [Methanobrevibacter arboriphilus]MBF4468453.1 CBS domain-containing protein [Methanobrevibacter arboriphilus]MCC7561503.1 CBS domain-containing protein [Methanobrevibacter arboriphilus]BBL62455.1 CBS domain-containing protein [Methanobrevibacter arboriphilus]GLI11597.1 CBS domain-containing protein [Methanobrevibacter arboriphilus]
MKDKSAINLRKSMERGSIENETRVSEHVGDIMTLAKKEVISVPPTTSIIEVAEVMVKQKFRRIPITDPGSQKLLGIVTAMDILNFLGGGDKFNIVEEKYKDNFLRAINESVREIMTRDVISMTNKDSINDCINLMLEKDVGALPISDENEKLVGIITERDFVLAMAGVLTEELVEDFMSNNVITTTPGTPIESASKIMVRNKLRRIPILAKAIEDTAVHNEKESLEGIITSSDVLKFLGDNELFSKMESNSALGVLETKISEIMEDEVITVEPLTRLGDLCEILREKDIGGVPVVKNGELLGIITESDILKAIKR